MPSHYTFRRWAVSRGPATVPRRVLTAGWHGAQSGRPSASRGLATLRLSVEFLARRSDRRPVRLQPGHQPADRLHELLAQRRERVLDARRHLGIDVAREEAVALEA